VGHIGISSFVGIGSGIAG